MRIVVRLALAASLCLAAGLGHAQIATDAVRPEAATGRAAAAAPPVASRHMVVAANPLAVHAGLVSLRAGGSAADALVAVQAVLGLVEPQSSGLGGGGFLVWYDAASGTVTTLDGRETAPSAAGPDLFLDAAGKPLGFFDAVVGGRSVGAPGLVPLLGEAHRRWGKRQWADAWQPAIALADGGFAISPRMAALVAGDAGRLAGDPTAAAYFLDANGAPKPAGRLLRNPAYAGTARIIAEGGADAFMSGPVADSIAAAIASHPTNPGLLSAADIAGYAVKERAAACQPYRGYQVCGMGPPSSGGIAIGQILGMLERFDLAALGPDDPQSWRIIGEATRLTFADRERYLADPDFVRIPEGMLDAEYLAARAALIARDTALGADDVEAGEPPWEKAELRRDGVAFEREATTHVSIVDDAGNVASLTSSIESAFGARVMVEGFLLNNQLTDFSFGPEADGVAVANRVEAGKRPRSSMSPTIVLRDGQPAFVVGSPGGSSIIPYVAKTLVALIDWRMDPQAAVALPHLLNRFGIYELEAGTAAEDFAEDLEAIGFAVRAADLNSGLHVIAIGDGGIEGGADPRREGIAAGD